MKLQQLIAGIVFVALATGPRSQAEMASFQFSGGGVSGSGFLTFEPDTVVGDPVGAYTITGISGTFSDSNSGLGLTDVAITGLVPINPPNPTKNTEDPLFPASFTSKPVPISPTQDPSFSYDNLFYPGGSPLTCPGYPASGGFLDLYGITFTLSNGLVVDLWSNGVFPGAPPASLDYGVLVMSYNATDGNYTNLDYVSGGVSLAVPEPGSLCLVGVGLLGVLGWRRRSVR